MYTLHPGFQVFSRWCTAQRCAGKLLFDGHSKCLLNMKSFLVTYEVLRGFMFHFLLGRYMYVITMQLLIWHIYLLQNHHLHWVHGFKGDALWQWQHHVLLSHFLQPLSYSMVCLSATPTDWLPQWIHVPKMWWTARDGDNGCHLLGIQEGAGLLASH